MSTRNIKCGVGDIEVSMPRVRDRSDASEINIKFYSNLIPKYMRRTATLDVMLPILYLKGISLNNFQDVLSPMLGINAQTISPGVISKLKESWVTDFRNWSARKLSDKKYVYFWVDGVYLLARMETDKTRMLVIVGADVTGKKEVVAMVDGFIESKDSWKDLLLDLRARGLEYEPDLAIGDGALGFWGAVNEVYPKTKHQSCWVHKTANILDKLPKSIQKTAKSMLHEIYLSPTKNDGLLAYDNFVNKFQLKYSKAVNCLSKDKEELLSFYDFPAEHWQHIRTTNPIESTFATVKHRTRQSRGCFSRNTIIGSTYKLLMEAEKRWKKLYGYKRLADIVNLVKFVDGISVENKAVKQEAA